MDVFQILVFSLGILTYLQIKMKKNISYKDILKLSIVLTIAFLTKFFSVFLIPIILIDSFLHDKKLFKYCFLSIIVSIVIISPYILFFMKFKLYNLVINIATTPFGSKLRYFDIFWNFGIFLGPFTAISTVWFLKENYKKTLFVSWLFIPLLTYLFFEDADARFAFILMPVYVIACGFLIEKIMKVKSREKRKLFVYIILTLIVGQLIYDIYVNYMDFVYPTDEFMKSAKTGGNVLIASEEPLFSGIYVVYGYFNNISGNVIRPCIPEMKMTKEFLNEWGVWYIIDQNNTINNILKNSLNLTVLKEKNVNGISFKLFRTNITNIVDCNFICILRGKVCKDQGFSRIEELINNVSYSFEK
jgi:hypothetical protein